MRALKKKPLQIYIDHEQDLLLESLAKNKGTSKAEIVRLSIDSYLGNIPPNEDPALGIVGLGRSGKGDIAKEHDKYHALYASEGKAKYRSRPLRKKKK